MDDRWGNRTDVWDTLGPGSGNNHIQSVVLQQSGGAPTNRLTSVTNNGTTVNYTYDAAGNVANDGVHTYIYDGANRLVSMDSGAAQYTFDQNNRRYRKAIGSSVTHYVWEGSQVVSEHDGTGVLLSEYIYSGSRMIAKSVSGVMQYFLSDRLSARVILDTGGNVTGRMAHLPYGEQFASTGGQEKHQFTSYERDIESGLDYSVNRHLAIILGRFLSVDQYRASGGPSYPQSWNRYVYVENDPINFVDPSGLLKQGKQPATIPSDPSNPFGQDFNGTGGDNIATELGPDDEDEAGESEEEPEPQSNARQAFKNFLQTMSQDCKDALKKAGLLDKVTNIANTAQVYDVNNIQQQRASKYVGGVLARGRETLGQWFDRMASAGRAFTVVRVPHSGIYIRGGEAAFAGNLYLELHEMLHLAFPRGGDLDESLGRKLGLTKGANESWSDAVSRFFNSKCTQKTP